jgi:hypothetical protein
LELVEATVKLVSVLMAKVDVLPAASVDPASETEKPPSARDPVLGFVKWELWTAVFPAEQPPAPVEKAETDSQRSEAAMRNEEANRMTNTIYVYSYTLKRAHKERVNTDFFVSICNIWWWESGEPVEEEVGWLWLPVYSDFSSTTGYRQHIFDRPI